jgi:Domain of unknown function (DUF4265)
VPDDIGQVKIRIPLSGSGPWTSETVWAEPRGDDLYEVWNMPWLADGVHLRDIVRCRSAEGEMPEFMEVVQPSGHDTLHIVFTEAASTELREDTLRFLEQAVGVTERAAENGWSVDVPPGVDVAPAEERLGELQRRGLLAGAAEAVADE